jgi:hypothetical protein
MPTRMRPLPPGGALIIKYTVEESCQVLSLRIFLVERIAFRNYERIFSIWATKS